jgi:FkbM family methyltransferase
MDVRTRAQDVRRRSRAAVAAFQDARQTAARATATPAAGGPETPDRFAATMQRDQTDFLSMRRLLAFSLGPDANCIDIGAHRGAVLAEMVRVAPQGHHIAFEPIPALAELLRGQFSGVEVHQAALSDAPGRSDFAHVRGDAEGWSGLRFRPLPTGEEADVEQITVPLEVLDEVLDPDYRPAVIKIDVEGAEEGVLRGGLATLRRHHPILIFEHGSGSAETYDTRPADVHALLVDELSYRIFDLDGNGPYSLAEFEHTFYTGARVNFVAHC